LHLAKDAPAVIWLFGQLSLDSLLERMMRRLDVNLSDGTELLLRYFDPRIVAELDQACDDEERQSFFGMCDRWCYLDRNGNLREIRASPRGALDTYSSPLVLTERIESALMLATEAGQVLAETLHRWPVDLQRLLPLSRFDLAKACCTEGDAMKLPSLADKVLLMMHVAEQGCDYLKSPVWAVRRQELVAGRLTLKGLLQMDEALA
jgi:hypothetical protein